MARNPTPVEWTHSKLHGAIEMQTLVSNVLTTPLEFGPLFCIHRWLALLTWKVQKTSKHLRKRTLKHWKPFLDEDGIATLYHIGLQHIDANSIYDPEHLPGLEKELFDAGLKGGYSKQRRSKYESSNALRDLRAQRRQAVERSIKKQLSFDIAKLHRRELRAWKSSRLQQLLNMPNQWKMLQKMSHTIVRQCAQHPPANDFADMLENIFHGHPGNPTRPLHLTEPNWSLQELAGAIKRLKMNKASDECGWVAELLHFAPDNVVTAFLGIMNQILHTGEIPSSWNKTLFQMLPKTITDVLANYFEGHVTFQNNFFKIISCNRNYFDNSLA